MSLLPRWMTSVPVVFCDHGAVDCASRSGLCPEKSPDSWKRVLRVLRLGWFEASFATAVGAHLPGSRRTASATVESADSKAQTDSASAKDAPAKKAPEG